LHRLGADRAADDGARDCSRENVAKRRHDQITVGPGTRRRRS
jgi:hypothetical protein